MSDQAVRTEMQDGVAVIHIDDGKANAISPAILKGLHREFDAVEKDAEAIVLSGRPGKFSAGFDLGAMGASADSAFELVRDGALFALRMMSCDRPIVAASSGHAIAMGAIMLMACDTRIGIEGQGKVGLSEVAIGMTLPSFGVEIARLRLSKRHFTDAVMHARMFTPSEAVDVGFLDQVVDEEKLAATAHAAAKALGALPNHSYRGTKAKMWGPTIDAIRAGLDEDIRGLVGGLASAAAS